MATSKSDRFPPAHTADEWGVVCWGGPLTTQRLIEAYRHGIFPWPDRSRGIWYTAWASPDPRAILPLDAIHLPRRLQRKARGTRFECTWNQRFSSVVQACASVGSRRGATWISPALQQAVAQLHAIGVAHSIEVWDRLDESAQRRPCGGLYGIALGGLFAAESMFHTTSDASKLAVVQLVSTLREHGFALLDVQQATPHLVRMGAIEISRDEYLRRLSQALAIEPRPLPPPAASANGTTGYDSPIIPRRDA
jgi:leucyl/phenylalanyl-tRNA--protein transferase